MKKYRVIFLAISASAVLASPLAHAEAMRSDVAFNNGIGQATSSQPADGMEVAYQVDLENGDLEGCSVDIVEALYPRDEGAWGIFDIAGDVSCDGGGFSYKSSGSWDGNGFHAAGNIEDGSGSGDYQGIAGRVVQLGGGAAPNSDGTADVVYSLVFDIADN